MDLFISSDKRFSNIGAGEMIQQLEIPTAIAKYL